MAISTQIQNLNLIPGKSAPVVVHLSQGNVGNTVQFYLYDGDNPYYPTNVSIAVHGVRADNTVFGPYAVSVTSGSNLVSFDIVTAMTSVNGAAIGELVISDSNQNQIGSANFGMLVEATPYSSSVTYEDDLSIYQRILAYVQSFPATMQEQFTDFNTRLGNTNTNIDTINSTLTSNLNKEIAERKAADNNEARARESEDLVLHSRIDQLVAPSGTAPSSAEVTDARIANSGTAFSSLGAAIRTQVKDFRTYVNGGHIDLMSGLTWSNNGLTGTGAETSTTDKRICCKEFVAIGRYELLLFYIDSGYKLDYCWYKSDKSFLSANPSWRTNGNLVLTPPSDAAFIRVVLATTSDGTITTTESSHLQWYVKESFHSDRERIDALSDLEKNSPRKILSGSKWVNASVSSEDGHLTDFTAKRIATAYLEDASMANTLQLEIGSDYNAEIDFYKADKSYITWKGWNSGVISLSVPSDTKYIRAVLKRSDNGDISVSESVNFACTYTSKIDDLLANGSSASGSNTMLDKLIQAKRAYNMPWGSYSTNPPPLVLLHFSDIHGNSSELERMIEFKKKYTTYIDDVVCTGDMVLSRFSNGMTFWDTVTGSSSILKVIGNHDVLTDETGFDWSKRATQQQQYDRYFANSISSWGCTYESGKTYYYKDYANSKVRFIAVNCMLTGTDETAQETWFQNALNGAATNGYTVIIGTHYEPVSPVKIDCNFSIIDQGPGTDFLDRNYMEKVQSFIDNGGSFACYLAGHEHYDIVVKSSEFPKQVCIIVDALDLLRSNGYNDLQRTDGTTSQDLANLVAVDTTCKVVKLIRVGANMDHYLRPRNCMAFKFDTGEIITQS